MRVIDFFDRGVALNPDRVCLKDSAVSRSYREVRDRSCRIANALRREELKPEDKAAVYSPNSAAAFECILGILRAQGGFTPSVNGCLENNDADRRATDAALPPPGQGYWYLVRGVRSTGVSGSYSMSEPRERPGRDAEIAASAARCP